MQAEAPSGLQAAMAAVAQPAVAGTAAAGLRVAAAAAAAALAPRLPAAVRGPTMREPSKAQI